MNETVDLLFGRIERMAVERAILQSQLRARDDELLTVRQEIEEAEAIEDAAEDCEPDISPVMEGANTENEEVTFEPCDSNYFCEYDSLVNGVVGTTAQLKASLGNHINFIQDTSEAHEWAIQHLRERNNAN